MGLAVASNWARTLSSVRPRFAHVAIDAALEADLVGGGYLDAEVIERDELGVMESEDAFYDDYARGCDGVKGSGSAGVGFEIVDGALDGVVGGEGADVLDEELGLEGAEGEVGEIAVVEIEREEGGF
jgi:hypothetical protein